MVAAAGLGLGEGGARPEPGLGWGGPGRAGPGRGRGGPEPGRPGDLGADARRAGYVWKDGQADVLLQAIRMRLRPWASGPADDTDRALVADLAARWPVAT